jgi:hypothetical protein
MTSTNAGECVDALEHVILTDEEQLFKTANATVDVQPKHILLAVKKGVSYGLLQKLAAAIDLKYADDELLKAAWEIALARGEDREMRFVKDVQGYE